MTEELLKTEKLTAPPLPARDKLVIGVLLVSAFVVILNETIMNVALPRLMEDLRIQPSTGQWLATAFLLTMAVVIPVTGFLIQRFSTRALFLAAMGLFTAGTLICATAPGFEILLVGRVVQASGTAIMMPLLMTTVLNLVPPAGRGVVMGNISIVISVAPAVGPTVSGLILSVLDWRWIFWIVLPIAAAALVIGGRLIVNVTTPRKVPLDVLSVLISAVAFGGLVFGLSGFGEPEGVGGLGVATTSVAIGALALGLFILRQLRLQGADRALLDLRTFTARNFTFAIAMMCASMIALFGTIIVLPIYMQNVLGLEPISVGLILLPGGLLMGLLGPVVGRLYDRFNPKALVIPGSVIVSGVLFGLSTVGQATPVGVLVAAHVCLSLGLALLFTPLFSAGLGALPQRLYSHGSATVGTLQQLAGAAGTALFIAVLAIVAGAGGGTEDPAATAAGVRAAFLCGAIISLSAVVLGFFIRKPADSAEPHHAGGH
ncbi:MAG: DHA2 family efflux MFS transporter permease subunit [Actinomycetota bacterium]|nr:DHA2 family efflux MFS transporter permease subunit [Actinomycetota bacterium]